MRRWLLWTFACRRGRLCADVVPDLGFRGDPPAGSVLRICYVCRCCGTVYESAFLLGDGVWTLILRRRLSSYPLPMDGVSVASGESVVIPLERGDGDADA